MPALLDQPITRPANPHLKPFNHERAVLAGKLSGQRRRERSQSQALTLQATAQPVHVQDALNAQLRLVAEQISRTRLVLNDDDYRFCEHCERGGVEPHHRAQLLKAIDVLLDRQRRLLGVPDLAPVRSKDRDSKRRSYSDLSSLVVEVQSCGLHTPTNSVPSQPAKPQTTQEQQGAKAEDFSI